MCFLNGMQRVLFTHDLALATIAQEVSLDRIVRIEQVYWVCFLNGMQRVLLFTHDLALATIAQEVSLS